MLGVELLPRNAERGQKAEDEPARQEARREKETSVGGGGVGGGVTVSDCKTESQTHEVN